MKKLNLIGQEFARLTVIALAENIGIRTAWLCRCECGETKVVITAHLRNALVKSCGCLHREATHLTHGLTRNKQRPAEYIIWAGMKSRCLNKRDENYWRYGGRGIRVCDEWRKSFERFLVDMGRRPVGRLTIERVDNDGHYEPGNCIWADYQTQARNRRNSVRVEYEGEPITVAELAPKVGIPASTIYARISAGRSPI